MKSLLSLSVLLALTAVGLQASGPRKSKQRMTGTLVDIACATDPKRSLTKLRSEHTRKCLLMPICKESGYALLTDRDEVLRFDARGNKLARELIERRLNNHGWLVSIEGILEGDQLTVDRMRLR